MNKHIFNSKEEALEFASERDDVIIPKQAQQVDVVTGHEQIRTFFVVETRA